MMKINKSLLAGALMASWLSVPAAFGAVTPYSWIRAGEVGIMTDSSGLNHPFNAAFSSGCGGGAGGGGLTAAVISQNAVGGPLGTTGLSSTISTEWGSFNCGNSGMWIQGPGNSVPPPEQWSLPPTNWVVEAWILPVDDGASGNSQNSQFLSTGSGQFGGRPGGVAFRTANVFNETTGEFDIVIRLFSIGDGAAQIGTEVVHDKKKWMHVAAVNDNGTTRFYVNGVAQGDPSTTVSAPSGVPYIGSGQDTGGPYKGFLDEIRFSTFAPGAFTVADLLLRPAGPGFISQPQSMSVWNGGAAPFIVNTVFDETTTYQWKKGDANIANASGAEFLIPSVAMTDSGSVYKVVVTNEGGAVTTPDATLTVVANQTENNNFYREAINAEASLLHYFPIDGSTGETIANTETPAAAGSLQGGTSYDGRINRSYGQRALRFSGNGYVTLAPSAGLEFGDGTGTIEALVFAERPKVDAPQTIISLASEDGAAIYYTLQVGADGSSLVLSTDAAPAGVAWAVSPAAPSLLNRLAHVAVVLNGATVTAYVDGISLGTKDAPAPSASTGLAAYIGSTGQSIRPWNGTIDEIAIYGNALSENTIAVHNSRFVYGTAVTAPTITTSPTGTWNLLAGGAPVFQVAAAGTAPLSYQWKLAGQAIANNPSATTSTLRITNSTVGSSGQYTVTVSNPIGDVTSAPFTVNFAAPPAGDKYAAIVLGDNPTAYWRLNELTGDKLTDYAGGFDGTYSATVTKGQEGAPGTSPDKAALFPGSGAASSVPFTPVLNPTGPFSVEFWAKPSASGNIGRAIVGTQNRNTGRAGYAIYQGFNVNGWEAHLGYAETVLFIQGQTPVVAGRWDHVVMTWDGANTARIWVNGIDDTNPGSTVNGPHRPNTSQPLEIGSRFNGSVPYNGTIDEVAFYNYKLTPEQIQEHFAIAYVPSSVTTQPAATVGGIEANTVTITAEVAGFPNTYQWFKDGVALENSVNADGSQHYPAASVAGRPSQGINGPTLVINHPTPSDNGVYQLRVTNPLANTQTTTSAVTIAPDLTAPVITKVSATANPNVVQVTFNKPMLAETAEVAANYKLTGGATVSEVLLTSDPRTVNLVTTGLAAGASSTLTVTGVKDQRASQNLIGANSTTFKANTLRQGFLAWHYFQSTAGNVDLWTAEPAFPNGFLREAYLTNFSTMSVAFSGNLNNNPEYGPMGDNYGGRVFGFLTPTVSGDYQFFLRSDDSSRLYLSTDADPANAVEIANEDGCCDPFKDPTETVDPIETSDFISLVAGQSYYIQAVYKEGGGGDHVEVAWRKSGDATPAAQLTPIPLNFLSSFAPADRGQFNQPTIAANGEVTFTWVGVGVLEESTNLVNWTPVAGNPPSGMKVTPAAGSHKFYRLRQ